MKKIKKILAFVLSTSMLLGGMNIQAFAGEQKETNTANTELDNQNEYVVPLTFYGPSGKLLTEEPYSGTVQDYMDNVALVKKNDNGTYHVTLQIENYEKIDILQFSKPGVISDDIAPSNAPMGTFNIPEKYIANNEENPSEATEYLKEQGQINEEWNDKYKIILLKKQQRVCRGILLMWIHWKERCILKLSIVMEEQMMTWKAICTEL